MSGGHFDYKQYILDDIVDQIENVIQNNNIPNKYGECTNYSGLTIEYLKQAVDLLKKSAIFVHRIDYLLSDDDSEESFKTRLAEDLKKG